MNQLAANPSGILVPASLLEEKDLELGDGLTIAVTTGVAGQSIPFDAQIVGTFDLFPNLVS
ncbi:MAG: hypothetical protein M0C28_19415 [Candidatus Moduliflexus flocculans]|nr:hypothetical protein [Candidatus Moduliflexus flocculans]